MTAAELALDRLDARDRSFWSRRLRLSAILLAVFAFYALSWYLAKVDLE